MTNELIRLKTDILLRGIDFSDTSFEKHVESLSGNAESSHGLFNYHDTKKYVPNEVVISLDDKTIRVETRSNKDSIYKSRLINNQTVLCVGDKVYCLKVIERPRFYDLTSPLGNPLHKYVNTMGEGCLRIYPMLNCDFDNEDDKCKFCGVNARPSPLNMRELLNEYLWAFEQAYDAVKPKCLFISTGTHIDESNFDFFPEFFREINNYVNEKKLLANTVFVPSPNISRENIDKLFTQGLGMISFNLEVWNNDLFEKYCPGKIKHFDRIKCLDLIKYCVEKYGAGRVKTNFVAGLDEKEDLINGIKQLGELGCYSSCTIFYPTPGAQLDKTYQNLDSDYYIDVYKTIYNTALKNNLKIPWTKESRISGLEWDIADFVDRKKSKLATNELNTATLQDKEQYYNV